MYKAALWFLAGVLTTAGLGAVAAPDQVKEATTNAFRDSPLGRLIQGQVGRILTLRSQLNLSDEQREQIHKIIKDHKPELAKAAKQIVEQKRVIRDAVISPDQTQTDIRKAADGLSQTITQTAVLAGQIREQIFAVLTPYQRQKVVDAIADRQQAVDHWLDEIAQP